MLKKFDFYAQLIIVIAAVILGVISLFVGTYFYFALLLLLPLGIWQVISAACHTFSGGIHHKKQILKNYWLASCACIIIFFAAILFRDGDGNELGTGMLGIAIALSFLTALYYLYIYKKYLLHAKPTEENTGIGGV